MAEKEKNNELENMSFEDAINELEKSLLPTLHPCRKARIKIKEILLSIFKIKSFFTEF